MLADNAWDPARLIGLSPWWREGLRVALMQYDLVPFRHPDTTTPLTVSLFSRWMAEAVAMADTFVPVSDATAGMLADSLRVLAPWRAFTAAELPVVHLASTWHPDAQAVRPAPGQPWRFVSVGTVEPRKRYDLLLDVFEEHWAGGGRSTLCIVGKPGWNSSELQNRIAQLARTEPRFEWLGGADDGRLQEEYLASSAFVSLSAEEGFGLPVVEAAAAGLPLVLSDIPVYREVAGEAAFFAGPGRAGHAALLGLLGGLEAGQASLPDPPAELTERTWADAAAELLAALAARPEPDAAIRKRWDHRAALALASAYRLDRRGGRAGPAEGAGRPSPAASARKLMSRARTEARMKIPQTLVRAMHARNQFFRICQQLDSRTSGIEARVAALARVEPTARALQQLRAEEADQLFRFEVEAILADLDRLLDQRASLPGRQAGGPGETDGPGETAGHRDRVAGLRERLRSGGRG